MSWSTTHKTFVTLALLALLAPGTAGAYVLLSPFRTWHTTPNYIVDDRGLAGVNDGDGGATRVANAVLAWNHVGAGSVLTTQVGSVAGFSFFDGNPMINFTDPGGDCTGSCLAATYTANWTTLPDGTTRIDDADVITNTNGYNWTSKGEDPSTSSCNGEYYVEGVMTHEVGHGVGLDHSTVSGATMKATVGTCDNGPASLATDDRNGAKCLYIGTHLTGEGVTFAGRQIATLIWGSQCWTTTNVDIFRDGVKVLTTPNDGAQGHMTFGIGGSANYWVCEAGSTTWFNAETCSNVVTVYFTY